MEGEARAALRYRLKGPALRSGAVCVPTHPATPPPGAICSIKKHLPEESEFTLSPPPPPPLSFSLSLFLSLFLSLSLSLAANR